MAPLVKSRKELAVVVQIGGPFKVNAPSDTSVIVVELTFIEIRK